MTPAVRLARTVLMRFPSLLLPLVLASCSSDLVHKRSRDGADDDGDTPFTNGTDNSGGATTGTDPALPDELVAAPGIEISKIELYQTVQIPLMENGESVSSDVPIVGGRDTLMRVYVKNDGFDGLLSARVSINDGDYIETSASISSSSSEDSLGSTLNVTIPADQIQEDISYKVEVGKAPKGEEGESEAPSFSDSVKADPPSKLRIVLVPIHYTYGGANRTPNLSDSRVEDYRAGFLAMYPVAEVNMEVGSPLTWDSEVDGSGYGWDYLLDGLASARPSSDEDAYYYGVLEPTASFSTFCGYGCVAGLGYIPYGAWGDGYMQTAIGLGYGGKEEVETALHEIGHNHGREHAPCGVSQADASYPYDGAVIGVRGYDIRSNKLIDPDYSDIMSYCTPTWISDYTYKALISRTQSMSNSAAYHHSGAPKVFDRVRVKSNGTLTVLSPVTLRRAAQGEARPVTLHTRSNKAVSAKAHYYAYSHVDGGVMLVERGADPTRALSLEVAGKLRTVTLSN